MTNKLIHTNSVYFALAILMVFATSFLFIETALAKSSDSFDVIEISDVIVADQLQEDEKYNQLSKYVYLDGQGLTDSEVYALLEHSHSQSLFYSTDDQEIEVQTSGVSCTDDDSPRFGIKITRVTRGSPSKLLMDDVLELLGLLSQICDNKKA